MCTLQAHIQCYDRFFEVFSNEVEYDELIIENAVSQLLLDFFDEVMVDVTLIFSSHLHNIQLFFQNQLFPDNSASRPPSFSLFVYRPMEFRLVPHPSV